MHAVLVSMTVFLIPQNQQSHCLLALRDWRVSDFFPITGLSY